MAARRYPCPCCRNLTLEEEPPGTYEVCKVCFWEDDPIQFEDPAYEGGANTVSLREVRDSYRNFGVSELRFEKNVRPARPNELP